MWVRARKSKRKDLKCQQFHLQKPWQKLKSIVERKVQGMNFNAHLVMGFIVKHVNQPSLPTIDLHVSRKKVTIQLVLISTKLARMIVMHANNDPVYISFYFIPITSSFLLLPVLLSVWFRSWLWRIRGENIWTAILWRGGRVIGDINDKYDREYMVKDHSGLDYFFSTGSYFFVKQFCTRYRVASPSTLPSHLRRACTMMISCCFDVRICIFSTGFYIPTQVHLPSSNHYARFSSWLPSNHLLKRRYVEHVQEWYLHSSW